MTTPTITYVVIYERTPNNWSAYVPVLPGCIATGKTRQEVEQLIRDGIAYHLKALVEFGVPIPEPGSWAGEVEV